MFISKYSVWSFLINSLQILPCLDLLLKNRLNHQSSKLSQQAWSALKQQSSQLTIDAELGKILLEEVGEKISHLSLFH